MKKRIRLTESELHKIVKESVNRILNEVGDTEAYQKKLAGLQARKVLKGDTDSAENIYRYAKEKRKGGKAGNDFKYNQAYCDYLGTHQEDAVKESVNGIIKEQTAMVAKIYSVIEAAMGKTFGRELVDGNDSDLVMVYLPNGHGEYITIKLGFGHNE